MPSLVGLWLFRSSSGGSPYLNRCPSNEHWGSSGEAAAEVESNRGGSGRGIDSPLIFMFVGYWCKRWNVCVNRGE